MIKFIATMYTKTVFVPCTIGVICLHFFQVSKAKWKVSKERDTHVIGPLGVSLSLCAYFEFAFAHLKNKKATLLQATVIVSRTL